MANGDAATGRLRDMHRLLCLSEEVSRIGSWSWRPSGHVAWSPGMYSILGFCSDAQPSLEAFLERVHQEDRARIETDLAHARSGAVDRRETEYRAVLPNAEERLIAAVIEALTNADGDLEEIIGVIQDITERKRVEPAPQVAFGEQHSADAQTLQGQRLQAIGTLAGGVAHDFNNLLLAISGNAQLALEECAPGHPAHVSLVEIRQATARAAALVRSLLTFSRAKSGEKHAIEVQPVIVEALRLLRAAVLPMIAIRFKPPETLPNVCVDPGELHQIIMNLGGNAAHAIGERVGLIEVSAHDVVGSDDDARRCADLRPGQRYVRIAVGDDGAGMSPEVLGRVFEPFFTTKPTGVGTGLGLSVVHGIVKNSGGGVEIDSEPGRGTRVSVYLPATEAVAESVKSTAASAQGGGQHVLYVDDEEVLVMLMTRLLGRLQYKVTGFTDPELALDDFAQRPKRFDVVVTDLSMPTMSGLDVAREVLRIRPDVPVIVTSGYIREEDARQAARIGVRALLLKSNTVEEMAQELFALFSESQSLARKHSDDGGPTQKLLKS